ncbi:MAG: hypothetical protein WC022_04255 [Parcubacteria group bacterium]
MEKDLQDRLDAQDKKLADIYASSEKMRKYFLWTLIVTVATILLPLIALALILPWFIKTLSSAYGI